MPKVIERPTFAAGDTSSSAVGVDTTNLVVTVLSESADYDNAFMAFLGRKDEWLRQGINPDLMARAAQYISGHALGHQALVNLHGLVEQETTIYNRNNEGEQ